MSPKKSKTEAGQLFLEKVGFKLYNVPSKMYQETFLVEFMSYYEFLLCTSYMVLGTWYLVHPLLLQQLLETHFFPIPASRQLRDVFFLNK